MQVFELGQDILDMQHERADRFLDWLKPAMDGAIISG